jgi:molybdate transport system substrate-binding protein
MRKNMLKIFAFVIAAAMVFTLAGCGDKESEDVTLNVLAAASLTDAMEEVNALYMGEHSNVTIVANYASSGALQQQIAEGAPCDVFLSASAAKMNLLRDAGLLLNDTRIDLLTNSIVLIVPKGSTLDIKSFMDLTEDYVTIIAAGDPAFVPAGKYAQTAFDALGITEQVTDKLVLGADVRAVLAYVETGNVDAGIVYATDALLSDSVEIVATAPDEVNDTIVYPGAIVKASEEVDAAGEYLDFLSSAAAMAIFEKYGFSPAN